MFCLIQLDKWPIRQIINIIIHLQPLLGLFRQTSTDVVSLRPIAFLSVCYLTVVSRDTVSLWQNKCVLVLCRLKVCCTRQWVKHKSFFNHHVCWPQWFILKSDCSTSLWRSFLSWPHRGYHWTTSLIKVVMLQHQRAACLWSALYERLSVKWDLFLLVQQRGGAVGPQWHQVLMGNELPSGGVGQGKCQSSDRTAC